MFLFVTSGLGLVRRVVRSLPNKRTGAREGSEQAPARPLKARKRLGVQDGGFSPSREIEVAVQAMEAPLPFYSKLLEDDIRPQEEREVACPMPEKCCDNLETVAAALPPLSPAVSKHSPQGWWQRRIVTHDKNDMLPAGDVSY